MKIDILIPTRGRHERLNDTLISLVLTCKDSSNYEVYLYIDRDDEKTIKKFGGDNVIIGEQKVLSECWNDLYKLGNGEILMHAADDIIFETQGWDEIVIEHFKKHPESLLYGKDGHQDKNCATHSFTSRSAADKIGYFVPPYFEADFNDVWLHEVYRKSGRLFYNENLMIRHNHRNADIKFDDETYKLAEERRKRAAKVWEEKKRLIDEDVKKLAA